MWDKKIKSVVIIEKTNCNLVFSYQISNDNILFFIWYN